MNFAVLRGRHGATAFLALAMVVAILAGLALSVTRPPSLDEARFANPALTLLAGDGMGTPLIGDTDYVSRTFATRTYWQPPGYFLIQAAWYRLVGFSLLSQRFLSLLFAPVLIAASWLLADRCGLSRQAKASGAVLMATSIPLLAAASNGRMDIISSALGWLGIFATLIAIDRREQKFVLLAHALIAASGLVHPNGLIFLVAAIALWIAEGRGWLRPATILLALVPYIVAGIAWGLYILQNLDVFQAQFFGNVDAYPANFPNVFAAVWREATLRYWVFFGIDFDTSAARIAGSLITKGVLLVATVGSVVWIGFTSVRASRIPGRRLAILVLVPVLGLALIPRNKTPAYFIYVVPSFTLALMAAYDKLRSAGRSGLAHALSGSILLAQLVWGAHLLRVYAPARTAFARLGECLRAESVHSEIFGSAEVAYLVGFTEVRDDAWMSSLRAPPSGAPRVVILNDRYRHLISASAVDRPTEAKALRAELAGYSFRYDYGEYQVLSRNPLPRCDAERAGP